VAFLFRDRARKHFCSGGDSRLHDTIIFLLLSLLILIFLKCHFITKN
jgi:hypothetical protein